MIETEALNFTNFITKTQVNTCDVCKESIWACVCKNKQYCQHCGKINCICEKPKYNFETNPNETISGKSLLIDISKTKEEREIEEKLKEEEIIFPNQNKIFSIMKYVSNSIGGCNISYDYNRISYIL